MKGESLPNPEFYKSTPFKGKLVFFFWDDSPLCWKKTTFPPNPYGLDINTATNYQLQHFKGIIETTKQIGRSLLRRIMGFFHSTSIVSNIAVLAISALEGRASETDREFCSAPSFLIIVLQWELFQQGKLWPAKPYQANRSIALLCLWLPFR